MSSNQWSVRDKPQYQVSALYVWAWHLVLGIDERSSQIKKSISNQKRVSNCLLTARISASNVESEARLELPLMDIIQGRNLLHTVLLDFLLGHSAVILLSTTWILPNSLGPHSNCSQTQGQKQFLRSRFFTFLQHSTFISNHKHHIYFSRLRTIYPRRAPCLPFPNQALVNTSKSPAAE